MSVVCLSFLGCEEPPDQRFATPEATINTMMTVYGADAMTQSQVQDHLARKQRFHLQDREQFIDCFADFEKPSDEGLTGFVFGRLAAAKDTLKYETTDSQSTITSSTSKSLKVVLNKSKRGNWQVVLRDSVPLKTQRQLHAVYKRAQKSFRPL